MAALAEANKLKNVQMYLEKNNNLLNHISKYGSELKLCEYFVDLEKNRTNETDQINVELKEIWRLIDVKRNLLREKKVDNLDLRSFKHDMVELQEKIYALKMKLLANNEMLKDEEKNMWEMHEIISQKLLEWDKPVILNNYNHTVPKNTHIHSDHKEVREFMDFVNKSNGHENGWSSEDHQLFLKLRNKYKNIETVAENLNKVLPDISIEAVKEHEDWFRKYLFLKNKKDEALEQWRRNKKENNSQDKEAVVESNKTLVKSRICLKPKDENVQEKIAHWKAEKEARRQQANTYEQIKIEKNKRLEEDKRKTHKQVKEEVIKWREAKLTKEQHEKVQKELADFQLKQIRAAEANKMIKQFRSQDDSFITKMRSSRIKEENQTTKRSKSSYLVDRDPERILKPTKNWLLRTSRDHVNVSAYVPNIREIPKLKIPEWRKNT